MKPFWLLLFLLVFVACSRDRDEPRALAQPTPPATENRQSIDVTVTGAPLSIRGVELSPSARAPGVFELGYRIEATDRSLQVPAQIMCRVGGHNLVYPSGGEGKVPGPRLASLYRPDPFSERADACQIDFWLGTRRIGAACWRAGTLADGPCSADAFPPPRRRDAFAVELAHAALELRHGTALISGLFTMAEPLAPGRKLATQIRCEDGAGAATGEGDLAFLPLDQIPAGASIYGPVAIFLDRTPAPDATCELRIISRAVDGTPTEQQHARYCLTTGAVRAGACPQN